MLYNLIEELRRKEYVLIRVLRRTLSNPNIYLTDRPLVATTTKLPHSNTHSLLSQFKIKSQPKVGFVLPSWISVRAALLHPGGGRLAAADVRGESEGEVSQSGLSGKEGRGAKAKAKGKQMQYAMAPAFTNSQRPTS